MLLKTKNKFPKKRRIPFNTNQLKTITTMSLHHDKGNFWTKVRSSTNKISSSLANLSIRSEHDGDSPNSTLIHKALVSHYVSKNEQFPSWLGEEEPQQQQQQQSQRNNNYNSQPQQQESIRQPVQTQRIQPQQPSAGTSRFASRFANEQQSSPAPSRFASSSSSGNGSRFASNSSNGSGATPTRLKPERSDSSSGNAMKDRLKRNNYRNNFGV